MKKFDGIYTALVTPFDSAGKINSGAVQRLVEDNIGKGVSGFYVCGSTGESYLLSKEERKYLLEAVCEAAGNKADVLVNIGLFSTEYAVELAKHAEKQEVKAVSSVPPFYFPFTMEEYTGYYTDLADAVDVPVLLYNIPAMSSVTFAEDDLKRLLANEKITGIKHTSYDLFQLQQLIHQYPEKNFFIGHDEIFLSALAVGAQAGIGSTYNIMAGKFIKMRELFMQGETKKAAEIQNEVNNVVSALCSVGVFKGIKEILKMQGVDCGYCRKPFKELDDTQRRLLLETAEKNGLFEQPAVKGI